MSRPAEAGPVGMPAPRIAMTPCGAVEYAAFGSGPPLLALHGAMGGYDQGVILARTIAADREWVICPSRPGYLGTPIGSGAPPERQADLCAALLDTLGVERTAVVAVSGGGPCALHFALRHRDRCTALVLVSTCGGPIETPIPLSFHLTSLLARWPFCVELLRRRAVGDIDRAARRSVADPDIRRRMLADPGAGAQFRALVASPFERMALRLPGTANDIAVTRTGRYALEQIAVPTLIVHGTHDRIVPFAQHAAQLAARIAGAELLAVDGGEHVAIFTHRDIVSARIRVFLNDASSALPFAR